MNRDIINEADRDKAKRNLPGASCILRNKRFASENLAIDSSGAAGTTMLA